MMPITPRERLIVALDVDTLDKVRPLVETLAPYVGCFKVGLELITSVGAPQIVEHVQRMGGEVFFDGKFDDIPNTVGAASRAAAALGVKYFDVHASAGEESVRAAVEHKGKSLVLAVTVLTSMSEDGSRAIFGDTPLKTVERFARMAVHAGVDGIVCSPHELAVLKDISGPKRLCKVTPGVRPTWAEAGDQRRTMTPVEALRAGATHLVIGRPILRPPSTIGGPVEAAKRIVEEIGEAVL